jgi:DNA-binding NarL/FixJ family response regulator
VPVRVVIVDDHPLFRDGLRSLLEARGVEVVGEAGNGREGIALARRTRPDVVLMDLAMPEMDGLTATRALLAENPETKIVILTASDEDADLFEAIKSGAQGYTLKQLTSGQFFELLEGVERGEPALTPNLARKLLQEFRHGGSHGPGSADPDQLTERELEVLTYMVDGITSNKELADRLVVSENTVKYHLRNILDKLHLQNRAQVVAHALRHHLVEPGGSGG